MGTLNLYPFQRASRSTLPAFSLSNVAWARASGSNSRSNGAIDSFTVGAMRAVYYSFPVFPIFPVFPYLHCKGTYGARERPHREGATDIQIKVACGMGPDVPLTDQALPQTPPTWQARLSARVACVVAETFLRRNSYDFGLSAGL